MHSRIRANARLYGRGGLVALPAALFAIAIAAPAAWAAVVPVTNDSPGAGALRSAMEAQPIGSAASFTAVPGTGTPHAVVDSPLSSFPTDAATAALITTGDAQLAVDPNTFASVPLGGGSVRGNTDFDVTVLRVDVNIPAGTNCLTFDFQFYSEEFPDFVGGSFNDAFIAELDRSTWTTAGSAISAPDNFAFDPSGNPISINATGLTAMSAGSAAGTAYGGATPLLSASAQVSPGPHSLFLSIFDQGDQSYDSATLIDRLHARFTPQPDVECVAGARPPTPPGGGGALEPIEGVQVVAEPRGTVRVRCPGEDGFRSLTATEVIAIGCTFDATKGRVTLTSLYNGTPETVTYYDGQFKVKQKEGAKPFLVADLRGELGCPGRSSKAKAGEVGELSAKRKKKRRRLWGDGDGHFTTSGNGGAASARGTKWLAADRCDRETLFRVRKGKVVIDDFDIPGTKNRVLKPGKTYVTKD